MPSKTDTQRGGAKRPVLDELENYFLDGDLEDDPFGSPNANEARNKRQDSEGLGIDEAVSVQKRAREPRVKLDETRLLSENGITKLRRRAGGLKLKGKGHEFSDAARLLSFYQLWLDDLFPKAKFLDALAMVEKVGHKKNMHKARMDWINEGKPTSGDDTLQETDHVPQPATIEAAQSSINGQGHSRTTPGIDDLFDEEDIYNATPQRAGQTKNTGSHVAATGGGPPDEDDLDALMAEAEAYEQAQSERVASTSRPPTSIFGSAPQKSAPSAISRVEDGEDDLDALMAEAEANEPGPSKASTVARQSIFGDGRLHGNSASTGEDELDALMAEEADKSATAKSHPPATTFEDEEEAMAEMDGLW